MTGPLGSEADVVLRADGSRLRSDMAREIAAAERGQQAEIPVEFTFRRDASGRLRDQRGRFVAEGRGIGDAAGDAASRGFAGRLRAGLLATMRGIGSAIRPTALVAGFASIGGAAAAAAGSLVQFVAALAPAAGIVAGLPAVLGVGVAALATLRIALAGVSDAFGAALGDDAAEFEESLQGLAPSAQETARALRALKPAFDDVRESVQGAFFAGFADSLDDVAAALLGPVTAGATAAATEFNELARGLADVATSAESVSFVEGAFDQLAGVIDAVTPGIEAVVGALINLGNVGLTAFDGMGGGLNDVLTRFADFINAAVESGEALGWIEGAMAVFRTLGQLLSSLGSIFVSIGEAASATGGDALGVFSALIGTVSRFLESAAGQTFLIELFGALNQLGAALGPVIESLGAALAGLLPTVGEIIAALGPGLSALIDGLGAGLATLAPALVPLASAIAGVAAAVAPVITVLGSILAPVIEALGPVVATLADQLGSIFEAVKPALDEILPLFSEFTGILGGILSDTLVTLGELLAALLPPIAEVAALLIEQMLPVWEGLSEQIGQLLPALGELITALVDALLPVIVALLPPFIELTTALAGPLIDVLNLLIPILTFLVEILTPIVVLIADIASVIINVLVGAIQIVVGWLESFVNWLGDLWEAGEDARQGLVDAWNGIGDDIAGLAQNISDWIDDVVQWFIDLPGRILNAISGLGSAIWDSITGGIGDLGDLIGFADGGIVNRETVARVGENNRPEVIVPLTKPARALALADASGLTDMIRHRDHGPGGYGRNPTGGPITVNVTSSTLSAQVLRREVERALADVLGRA